MKFRRRGEGLIREGSLIELLRYVTKICQFLTSIEAIMSPISLRLSMFSQKIGQQSFSTALIICIVSC